METSSCFHANSLVHRLTRASIQPKWNMKCGHKCEYLTISNFEQWVYTFCMFSLLYWIWRMINAEKSMKPHPENVKIQLNRSPFIQPSLFILFDYVCIRSNHTFNGSWSSIFGFISDRLTENRILPTNQLFSNLREMGANLPDG